VPLRDLGGPGDAPQPRPGESLCARGDGRGGRRSAASCRPADRARTQPRAQDSGRGTDRPLLMRRIKASASSE
jgi:hypothetical protein